MLLELEKFRDVGGALSSGMFDFRHGSFWPPQSAKSAKGNEEHWSDQRKFRRISETLFSLELAITEQIDSRHGSFLAIISEGKLEQEEYACKR